MLFLRKYARFSGSMLVSQVICLFFRSMLVSQVICLFLRYYEGFSGSTVCLFFKQDAIFTGRMLVSQLICLFLRQYACFSGIMLASQVVCFVSQVLCLFLLQYSCFSGIILASQVVCFVSQVVCLFLKYFSMLVSQVVCLFLKQYDCYPQERDAGYFGLVLLPLRNSMFLSQEGNGNSSKQCFFSSETISALFLRFFPIGTLYCPANVKKIRSEILHFALHHLVPEERYVCSTEIERSSRAFRLFLRNFPKIHDGCS